MGSRRASTTSLARLSCTGSASETQRERETVILKEFSARVLPRYLGWMWHIPRLPICFVFSIYMCTSLEAKADTFTLIGFLVRCWMEALSNVQRTVPAVTST